MRLLLTAPHLPTCADCQRWLYDLDTGKRLTRADLDIARAPKDPPPCYRCPKSQDGTPNPDAELSARNNLMLLRYYEVKAGAPMPDDPVFRRNCAFIRWEEDQIGRGQERLVPSLLAAALVSQRKR